MSLNIFLAIQWWGYRIEEFEELSVDEQARIVAVYNVKNTMDSVIAKAQADEIGRD